MPSNLFLVCGQILPILKRKIMINYGQNRTVSNKEVTFLNNGVFIELDHERYGYVTITNCRLHVQGVP